MSFERLKKQLHFLIEADKLKNIYRRTYLICDTERLENDAEHSWHLTLIAIILLEYATKRKDINQFHVLKMLIIHDMVEIDAGDTYCYDQVALQDKGEREIKAANRLFSILPEDQQEHFLCLWKEFEEQETIEAKYAAAIDRIQPLLLIYFTQGRTWIDHGIDLEQELKRNELLKEITPALWDYAKEIIHDAAQKGYLKS